MPAVKSFYSALILLCSGIATTCMALDATPVWPDTDRNRLLALALTQEINIEILSSRSATRSLEQWCAHYRLAEPAQIVAKRIATDEKPATAEQRRQLQVQDDQPLRYRHVQLLCGNHILSEADNWYVPSRLTPEMNRLLDTTDTPFGKVVQPLQFYRYTLSVQRFWPPLPESLSRRKDRGGNRRKTHSMSMPAVLFEHQALLYDSEHRPISLVDEFYQSALLNFAPPQ
jgi:chorismate-pyruvate lyase